MHFIHFCHVLAAILFLTSQNNAVVTCTKEIHESTKFGRRFLDKRDPSEATKKAPNLFACTELCSQTPGCKSSNYNLFDGDCELNEKDHTGYKKYLVEAEGFIYFKNPKPEPKKKEVTYKTCGKLKKMNPASPSGNYELDVNGTTQSVYCDMDKFGGGWSLVVSISGLNTQHTLRTENNCFNSTLCVPLATGTLVARKFADSDIRLLASYEGTFRVDVTSASSTRYTGFFRFSQGSQVFDAGCKSYRCPRIIASHVYPYAWESNCNGIEKGYQIPVHSNCYGVFDDYDNGECGSNWYTSKYNAGERVLYTYCRSNGMHAGLQGNMYVR